jgi:hypothetical protein
LVKQEHCLKDYQQNEGYDYVIEQFPLEQEFLPDGSDPLSLIDK